MAQTPSPPGIVTQKSVFTFKIRDASGQERVYHSLEELPPEIQETVKRLHGPAGPVPGHGITVQFKTGGEAMTEERVPDGNRTTIVIPGGLIAAILFVLAAAAVLFFRFVLH
jgi:hypothetical protein